MILVKRLGFYAGDHCECQWQCGQHRAVVRVVWSCEIWGGFVRVVLDLEIVSHDYSPPNGHQRFALDVQRQHQIADFGVGLAGNASCIQRLNFIRWPAHSAWPQADGLGPQALRNAKVDGGAGVARLGFGSRDSQDGVQHVGTSVGVVGHAAIQSLCLTLLNCCRLAAANLCLAATRLRRVGQSPTGSVIRHFQCSAFLLGAKGP